MMTKVVNCEKPSKLRGVARRHELGGGRLASTTGKESRRAVTSYLVSLVPQASLPQTRPVSTTLALGVVSDTKLP